MNICILGKHRLRPDLTDNSLNAPIFLHFAKTFDRVFLIYVSPDGSKHHAIHENVEVFLLPNRGGLLSILLFVLRAFNICRRIHREYGLDVVSGSELFGGGLTGFLLRRLMGIPFVFQIQGQLMNLPKGSYSWPRRWLTRTVARLVAGTADAVRCTSSAIKHEALGAGVPENKLRVIGARIDLERFNSEERGGLRTTLRADLRLSPGNFTILYVGALLRDKGVYELVDAMRLLLPAYPAARLVLVGGGSERVGLEQVAASAGLTDEVIFIGPVEHDVVAGYLAAADAFVSPTRHEGWGRAIGEAMAMSLPVVASNVGGVVDLITDDETGLLLETGTGKEISAVVARLIEDPELRRRLGESAREKAEREWPFEKQADGLVRLHVELVQRASD